ncbi:MAG: hypothetical protein ACD_4C00441G0009 [uncultured bacterium (gcode 4)]|uniref:Prepilin-type N-terminal cleavage/methylation domain-containing protein n=1 Tax=uncultured bacterium (gcode 4) TaxID=1234023 RepID=K2F4T4_9BACT|nr:MAG: hypothetical protein ACD_4C00441G0009 [uncultured bacterium (gcode 4)]
MSSGIIWNKKGFTLVEFIISLTILSGILVLAFQLMANIWITKNIVSNRMDLNKDLYYSVENLVSTIKDFWWEIDYEEYWNRKSSWTQTLSWHYSKFSWFWNYWSGWDLSNWILTPSAPPIYWDSFYLCRSWSGVNLTTLWWWCLTGLNSYWNWVSLSWIPQRYWEYNFQFIDYNFNKNNDLWDEDWNWKIKGDEDDYNLWVWPTAFSWNEVKELYLINKWKKERFLLRMNYAPDPDAPTWISCNWLNWSWCLWNIQILKLIWKDLWYAHSWSLTSSWKYDWVIDTWACDDDFPCNWTNKLPIWDDSEWVNLFPDFINVKNAKFFLYPNKDFSLAYNESSNDTSINPYLRLNITLWYAWSKKKMFNNLNSEVNISTSINLN